MPKNSKRSDAVRLAGPKDDGLETVSAKPLARTIREFGASWNCPGCSENFQLWHPQAYANLAAGKRFVVEQCPKCGRAYQIEKQAVLHADVGDAIKADPLTEKLIEIAER